GPVVRGSLNDMYNMPPEAWRKVEAYTARLRGWMIETIVHAVHDLKPARLAAGKGMARFAVNRRKPPPSGFVNDANPGGPVDHDVPVLKVDSPEGKLRAIVFGYACHNTTLQFYRWCGDYAGFAMADLEAKHPGATALFWIGCGADANPLPRSKVSLCQKYGRELASAVDGVLDGEVVVDYAMRLKRELAGSRAVWITGYANDVMAYIPSLRVLREGGYEGDTSMIYYGLPTKWAPPIEEKIVSKVHELARQVGY